MGVDGNRTTRKTKNKKEKNTMKTNTCKKLLTLCMTIAMLLTVLALPVSAKTASGFQYYLTESYDDEFPALAVITGHKASVNGKLVVPEQIKGHTVYMISAAAFSGRKDITSVVLPDSIEYVEEYAFEDCSNLKSLTVGAAYIERGAFSGCKSLKKIHITAYNYEDMSIEYNWSDTDNDPLYAADWDWVHYHKGYDNAWEEMTVFVCRKKTLTCDYADAKATDTYHWYMTGDYCMESEEYLGNYSTSSVTVRAAYVGNETICCEVVNASGDVVYVQGYDITVRPTLGSIARRAAENSLLYGLANYTYNHIRWQYVDPMLEKLGIAY